MIYLKKFDTHASYEADFNGNGGGRYQSTQRQLL